MNAAASPDRITREETIFNAAVELRDPAKRVAYLELACDGDPDMRARLEKMLAADGDSFFEKPIHSPSPADAATLAASSPSDAEAMAPGERIGRYKLLQRIGEGGCGVVYMAEQEEPVRRRVALKVIKLGMDTKSVIARFEAERQALALMDHPNVAKVLDGGATDAGRPYFVMELVRGTKITEYCDQHNLSTRDRLDLFIKVCQAIQHAHQKGIIHRDIKPSNILVTLHDGVPVPKVIDFGIAKATTDQRLTDKTLFTALEQFIGTPAYMSPEQAEMSGLDIDTRCDIYSLGVLLYELLTGKTPFDATELMASGIDAMRKTIREQEPLRPSTKLSQTLVAADKVGRVTPCAPPSGESTSTAGAHGVTRPTPKSEEEVRASSRRLLQLKETIALLRGDVDWIVMKCLEKDRARRYETANGLASDIQRHLNNEAVLARPPSAAYRFQKLVRRNKLAFAAAGAVACALLLGVVVSTLQAVRATNAEQAEKAQAEQARADRDRAVLAEGDSRIQAGVAKDAWATARRNAYAAEINVAFQSLAENNLARAIDLLNRQRPKPGEEDLRGFEWRYLWQLCRPDEKATFYDQAAQGMAFSLDGKWLAYADGKIVIREVASQAVVATIPNPANTLAFSPRAKLMASGHESSVRLWSTESWEEVRSLPGTRHPAVFSPDGRWLVTGAEGGYRVWNTETWEPAGFCAGGPRLPWHLRHAVAFSPDGKLLVTPGHRDGIYAGQFQVWDFPSLTPRTNFGKYDGDHGSAAFAPDGKYLLTGRWDGVLLVWNVAEGNVVQTLSEHTAWITAITFARDGKTFATASSDRTLMVWDAATRQPLVRLRGHLGEIWSVAMSPDGRTLASGSPDGTTKLWDATTRHEVRELAGFAGAIGFSADSRLLVAGSKDGVSLWHLADGATTKIPVGNASVLRPYQTFGKPSDAHGNEPLGVMGRLDGALELWNLATRSRLASWPAHDGAVTAVVFSPDGRLIASGSTIGEVKLWEVTTHREVKRFVALGEELWCLAFSPDGRLLAGSGDGSRIRVWDSVSGSLMLELGGYNGTANSVAFSPDGKLLATGIIQDNTARLWDIPSGRPRATLKGHVNGVFGVAFTPDGKTLASGSDDRKVKLWNIATEQEVVTLQLPSPVTSLKFSPDGRTLAVGYRPEFEMHLTLRLCQAPSFDEIAATEAKEKTEIKQP